MEYKEIDILIEKYFEGESSLKDEIVIQRFLLENEDLPEKYEHLKAIFLFFDNSREQKSSLKFESIATKSPKKRNIFRLLFYAAAASIVLAFGIWFLTSQPEEKKIYAYINGKPVENEEQAYKEAQKALLMFSKNLNEGTQKIKPLSEFDKAISKVNKD